MATPASVSNLVTACSMYPPKLGGEGGGGEEEDWKCGEDELGRHIAEEEDDDDIELVTSQKEE